MSTFTPQERDIIYVSLEGAEKFCERFQENLSKKARFVLLSEDERNDLIERDRTQLESATGSAQINCRIRLSWYYEMHSQIDDAISVLENTPTIGLIYRPHLYTQLISLYERSGKYREAYFAYEQLLKRRPAVCLQVLPNGEMLICGYSRDTKMFIENFDEKSNLGDIEGGIHLSFLGRIQIEDMEKKYHRGQIDEALHVRLLEKLREYLKDPLRTYLNMSGLYKVSPHLGKPATKP